MKKFIATLVLMGALTAPVVAQAPPPATFEEAASLFQDKNYPEAKKIADTYAQKNDARAFFLLGTMAQKGLGEEVDLKQAQIWFQKGADAGDADNELALAMLLLAGGSGKPNIVDGAPWLQKAAL